MLIKSSGERRFICIKLFYFIDPVIVFIVVKGTILVTDLDNTGFIDRPFPENIFEDVFIHCKFFLRLLLIAEKEYR